MFSRAPERVGAGQWPAPSWFTGERSGRFDHSVRTRILSRADVLAERKQPCDSGTTGHGVGRQRLEVLRGLACIVTLKRSHRPDEKPPMREGGVPPERAHEFQRAIVVAEAHEFDGMLNRAEVAHHLCELRGRRIHVALGKGDDELIRDGAPVGRCERAVQEQRDGIGGGLRRTSHVRGDFRLERRDGRWWSDRPEVREDLPCVGDQLLGEHGPGEPDVRFDEQWLERGTIPLAELLERVARLAPPPRGKIGAGRRFDRIGGERHAQSY